DGLVEVAKRDHGAPMNTRLALCWHEQHNDGMRKSITIRDVPRTTRDELAARAALTGRSLQEYLRAQLIALARPPDAEALFLRVELFPYEPFAERVWDLRTNVTAYDGWYVALAETLGARLATLDTRLSRAKGPRCAFTIPPG